MKDVLTTANAAQLLGVSVRTAQLWVESGQLPSWKTPGGHRRIPRQAVLDLIDNSVHEEQALRAHAVVFAGEGRGDSWRNSGLPTLGLIVDVSEDIDVVRQWLTSIPPMLVVIESADDAERKKLLSSLERDVRFGQVAIVSSSARSADYPVSYGTNRIRIKALSEVQATASMIVQYLSGSMHVVDEASAFRVPWNECSRLKAVGHSGLIEPRPDPAFDRLVRLAAHSTKAPIAMFTIITQDDQWFKSRMGFDGHSTPRDWAFCNETLIANEFTVLDDLSKRDDLAQNPTLSQPYGFRFYAGAPVRDSLGFVLGSICVIDIVPRSLSHTEREALTTIADAASNLIHVRNLERELQTLRGSEQ